jgi:hypothetical protein
MDSLEQQGGDRSGWLMGLDFRTGLKWLAILAGQTALLGALLFYFGWVRTQSLLIYFGLDNNIVRLSWNDYVLRSPNLAIRALTLACVVAILLMLVGGSFWAYLGARPISRRWLPRFVFGIAAIVLVLGILGYFNVVVYSATFPFVPIFIATAVGLFILGAALSSPGSEPDASKRSFAAVLTGLLLLTAVLCAFWSVSVYATHVGDDFARSIERSTSQRPNVTIYSEDDLSLAPPVSAVAIQGTRFKMKYRGLRLLIYAADRFVLIPDNWKRRRDPVYPNIRVEITWS